MIKRLRVRFIYVAMISITSVMLLFCLIVNAANFVRVDSALSDMLHTIAENEGTLPKIPSDSAAPSMPIPNPGKNFTAETPYQTRFFVLRYTDEGMLVHADLDKIAAVDENDTEKYLSLALNAGEGEHYTSGYKYYVKFDGNGRYMAIFLDCHDEVSGVLNTALLSLVAAIVCIGLVYLAVCMFSRRAVDPVVRASEKQKQFITDASHELRTPITVIATCLSVLEMETGKQKWIDKARLQTEKLSELVSSLVALSRMDEESSPLNLEPFDVSAAALETAESFVVFAESHGHELEISVEENISYTGDEYAVRQLISILLDNAVKYAKESSKIAFSLTKGRRGITISTANECDGIDRKEVDRLFDRFYRHDRSRTSSGGGFGIGLSLARSICEGHGGSISAEVADGRIVFTAELK